MLAIGFGTVGRAEVSNNGNLQFKSKLFSLVKRLTQLNEWTENR